METTLPDPATEEALATKADKVPEKSHVQNWLGMSPRRVELIQKSRRVKDRAARLLINIGGVAVIAAVALIFFYLLLQIIPLFRSAELAPPQMLEMSRETIGSPGSLAKNSSVNSTSERELEGSGGALGEGLPIAPLSIQEANYLSVEEQFKSAVALYTEGAYAGRVDFYDLRLNGSFEDSNQGEPALEKAQLSQSVQLPLVDNVAITAIAENSEKAEESLILVAQGSQVIFWRHTYENYYEETAEGDLSSSIIPGVEFPYGESPYTVVPEGETVIKASLIHSSEALVVASYTQSGKLFVKQWSIEEDLFGESRTLEEQALKTLAPPKQLPQKILLEPAIQWLYSVGENTIEVYNLLAEEAYHSSVSLTDNITSIEFLLGDISLLVGDEQGLISQWFMVRNDEYRTSKFELKQIRTFSVGNSPIVKIVPEQRRKSFYAIDKTGQLAIYYTTAQREVFKSNWFKQLPSVFSVAPRGNFLLYNLADQLVAVKVDNHHPEVSWSSLWEEVWYENYIEPEYIWQSSAANNDFEPKFSLTPLAFGTIKAAIYAMIVAVPLSICGAIYTAYFMAPALRKKIKPTIEFMEALPTVILGFLAGLWLAPFVENHLPGIFSLLILMPISFLMAGYLWTYLPKTVREAVPEGWQPLLLIPVVIGVAAASFAMSGPIENAFFDGSVRTWLTNDLGIGFDQRNALVVGLAMGFAVIPTIYSITEDALFAVPKSLNFGSLALGATPWQTMVRVVLPTASPGIFSALMIGFGRAVGETMIVLMATGNTPIMDMNIFEGLRTLSANIAVEMPEAELHSTHYRLLFLAAFVLFVITFCFNTTAEVVRQRLREKYGSL